MNKRKKLLLGVVVFLLLSSSLLPVLGKKQTSSFDKDLPPPTDVNVILEQSIFQRMSVRDFTDEPE